MIKNGLCHLRSSSPGLEELIEIIGSEFWQNYTVEFRVRDVNSELATCRHAGVAFGLHKSQSARLVYFRYQTGEVVLASADASGRYIGQILAHRVLRPDDTEWHKIEVRVVGNALEIYSDGQFVFDYKDTQDLMGTVGLWAYDSYCQFDNVKIVKEYGEGGQEQ